MPKVEKATKDSESSKDLPSDKENLAVTVNSLKTVKSQLGSDHEAGNSSSLSLPRTPKIAPPKDGSPASNMKPPNLSSSSADTAVSGTTFKMLKDSWKMSSKVTVTSPRRKEAWRNLSYVSSGPENPVILSMHLCQEPHQVDRRSIVSRRQR